MKTIYFVIAIIIFTVFISYSQKEKEIVNVAPYQTVTLPQNPLVFFPVTSLEFNKNKIAILDASGKDVTNNKDIVEIIEAKVYKANSNGSNSGDGSRITFNTTLSGGTGYPAGCFAKIQFKKAGTKYTVKFNPTPSGGPETIPFPLSGSYPGDKLFFGSKEMTVNVGYPTMSPPSLDPVYFYGTKGAGFQFKCLEFQNESLYSYKFFLEGVEVAEFKGYMVNLDEVMTNLEYNGRQLQIHCMYDNNIIPLGTDSVAIYTTTMKADFKAKVNSKWKEDTYLNAPVLDLSDAQNLTFEFYYELEKTDGSIIPKSPINPQSIEGVNMVTLDNKTGIKPDKLELTPLRYVIKLRANSFADISAGEVVQIEFNFVDLLDSNTRKPFIKKLYCVKQK